MPSSPSRPSIICDPERIRLDDVKLKTYGQQFGDNVRSDARLPVNT